MAECGAGEELREDALIDFITKKGGRVKNKELVERFKKFINAPEPQLKAKYRDVFKDIVNKIALVKQEDGEKYIVLKKKYQHLVQERDGCNKEEMTLCTPVEESVEQLQKKDLPTRSGEEKLENSISDAPHSKKRSQAEAVQNIDISGPLSSKIYARNTTAEKVNMCEWIVEELPTPTTDTKSKAPSELTCDSQDSRNLYYTKAFEEKQDKELDIAPESNVPCPMNIEVKVEEPQEEEFDSVFKDDSEQNGFEDGSGSMGSPSVALDPLEKEWLKCAASGHLTALCDLLRQDPALATKKDFTSCSSIKLEFLEIKLPSLNEVKVTCKPEDRCPEYSTLYDLCTALVWPQLKYCAHFWAQFRKDVKALEKMQKRFTKMVPEIREFSYMNRLDKLGCSPLKKKVEKRFDKGVQNHKSEDLRREVEERLDKVNGARSKRED
ncbi:ankyrin repeat domain-containing protein SOWAHA-like [Heterodontus francisci]|uniref:ankyrin repeat domain-containing protein SOWAHA-like n=1 Tax=Heterodontus francisci TaxID=7792 RepID=UPI00355C8CFE